MIRYAAVYLSPSHEDQVQESCGHRHYTPEAAIRCRTVVFPALRAVENSQWRALTDAEFERAEQIALYEESSL